MNKITIIILAILFLGFGGLVTWSIIYANQNAVDYNAFDSSKIIPAGDYNGNIAEHVRGKADSPVVIVEYGDMQCAGCATAMPRMKTLLGEYGDRVAFVFRNFPIQSHPNARAAAAALESAGLQGYFWEMADTAYANQAVWSAENGSTRTNAFADLFKNIAPDGDIEKFKSDLGSRDIDKKISFDSGVGTKLDNVQGTPAFFLGGKNIDISGSGGETAFLDLLREKIDEQLKENNLPTGPAVTTDQE